MKNSSLIIGGIVVLALDLGLFVASGVAEPAPTYWPDTEIAYIAGHTNLALHIHPNLKTYIDGKEVAVPGNIGISGTCMAEMHTHDGTGVIHIESIEAGRTFTVADFFTILAEPLEKEAYTLSSSVNGDTGVDLGTYELKDHDVVILSYGKNPDKTGKVCIQVIQPARNPETGQIREFPTPCDVPAGWENIQNDVPGLDLEIN